MPFVLATALLVGLDLYLSFVRMRDYGPRVELNPVARQLAQDYGAKAGIAFLGLYNAGLLAAIHSQPTLVHILFGAKLGLAAMQLKSIQLETYVERLLKGKK